MPPSLPPNPTLHSLLREWVALAVSEWPAPQPGEASQPLASFDSLNRVEGAALVLLCSTDVEASRGGGGAVGLARVLLVLCKAVLPFAVRRPAPACPLRRTCEGALPNTCHVTTAIPRPSLQQIGRCASSGWS